MAIKRVMIEEEGEGRKKYRARRERKKERINSTVAGTVEGKQRRQQFYDLTAQLKEWRKRRGCIYTEGCEFHSISRPLTIERVRSPVCTQDISTERSSVEILRNAQRNLCLRRRPSAFCVSARPNRRPCRSPVLLAISPRDGVKDFRLRFVAAFVPLRSVSSPLRAAPSNRAKKDSSPPSLTPGSFI